MVIGRDMWHDEAFQWLYAQKPVSFILSSTDVHPPLFNLFTKMLLTIGITDIVWLRFVMFSISCIFVYQVYLTGKELFNVRVGYYASIAAALLPTFIFYATEFRSYQFVLLLVVIQIRYFNKMLKGNFQEWYALGYIFLSTAMLYSHYMAFLVIAAQMLYLFTMKKLWAHWAEFLFICVFSLPALNYALNTIPNIQSFWFVQPNIISYVSTYSYLLAMPGMLPGFFAIIIYGLIVWALWRFKIHRNHIQMLIYAVFPVTLLWVVSQFLPYYHHRYFLFGGVGILFLWGYAVDKLEQNCKDHSYFAIAMLVVVLIYGMTPQSFNYELQEASEFIKTNYTSDLPIVHTSTFSMSPMRYYLPNRVHLLQTNLNTAELFTAGGSVCDQDFIVKKECIVPPYILVSDTILYTNTELYNFNGLRVTKIEANN